MNELSHNDIDLTPRPLVVKEVSMGDLNHSGVYDVELGRELTVVEHVRREEEAQGVQVVFIDDNKYLSPRARDNNRAVYRDASMGHEDYDKKIVAIVAMYPTAAQVALRKSITDVATDQPTEVNQDVPAHTSRNHKITDPAHTATKQLHR